MLETARLCHIGTGPARHALRDPGRPSPNVTFKPTTPRAPGQAGSFLTTLSDRRGHEMRWQCGSPGEAKRRCTWYTLLVARSRAPVPLAFAPDDVGRLTLLGPSGLLNSFVVSIAGEKTLVLAM